MSAKKKAAAKTAPKSAAPELEYTSTVTSHGGTKVTKTAVSVAPSLDETPARPKTDEERAASEARRLEYEG